jgi:hypothetical protein
LASLTKVTTPQESCGQINFLFIYTHILEKLNCTDNILTSINFFLKKLSLNL